ncbi:hypothetical protein F3Y22_tig00007895pilonHSYRG00030 [Hibiscus syriacus]|uniref:Squalene monooxygenase n=1 Tax=Hibiscus syriacus TaxID=106335 RepID=A0A6A3C9P8_HIBSY|nr:hypothetical protein F3Y22_tig00007895pilonHSYRG00030 [Hibiscus syriacus]
MPNRTMPAAPHPAPGALLMGDAFNMIHPLTGGGMTVALSDIVVLRDLLRPLHDLHNASALYEYLESFYTFRKPVASTLNTLAGHYTRPMPPLDPTLMRRAALHAIIPTGRGSTTRMRDSIDMTVAVAITVIFLRSIRSSFFTLTEILILELIVALLFSTIILPLHIIELIFCHAMGLPLIPPIPPNVGFEKVLKHMIQSVEKTMQPDAIKFFRTQSPRHFEGGDWDHGGSCHRLNPLLPEEVDELFSLMNNGKCGDTPCESTPIQGSEGIKVPNLRYYPHE